MAATQKHHRHERPISDWSNDSASETEHTPKRFERHPSKPYYIGNNKDNDDLDISLHAHDESFDDDSNFAFAPKQIFIMKSTMMDILKAFQESRDQRTDLNLTSDNFSDKLPR